MTLSWTPTGFGSAEFFQDPGTIYSDNFNEHGEADVIAAAKDFIEKHQNFNDTEKKIALVLLENKGASVDMYFGGTRERWVVYAGDLLDLAWKIGEVL